MRYERLGPLALAAAFAALYLQFAIALGQSDILQRATSLEQMIFALQIGKIAIIASVKRLRDMRFVNVINILGAELVVALPVLALADLALGDQGTSSVLSQIFLGWVAGAATSLTPYAVYRLARAMILRDSLVVVLPSGVLLTEVVLLLQMGTSSAISSGLGISSLSRTIILVGGGAVTSGAYPIEVLTLIPLSIIYISLVLHGLAPHEGLKPKKFVVVASLALAGTAVAYSGSYASSVFATPFAYFSIIPTLLTASLVWWRTRET